MQKVLLVAESLDRAIIANINTILALVDLFLHTRAVVIPVNEDCAMMSDPAL